MKKIWLFMILFLCTTCLVLTSNVIMAQKSNKIQQELASQVIRFHVRANGDKTDDQEIKIKVKNAVIEYLRPLMRDQKNIAAARMEVLQQLPKVESVIKKVLYENDISTESSVRLTKEYFPEKCYGAFVFPKGTYEAVVISVGEGKGQNWWCMLYPGLCFVNESYAVVSAESGEKLEKVLSEDAFAWIGRPEGRRLGFRWLDFGK